MSFEPFFIFFTKQIRLNYFFPPPFSKTIVCSYNVVNHTNVHLQGKLRARVWATPESPILQVLLLKKKVSDVHHTF